MFSGEMGLHFTEMDKEFRLDKGSTVQHSMEWEWGRIILAWIVCMLEDPEKLS
jgi:hypothetical protein